MVVLGSVAGRVGGANNDHVLGHTGRGVQADIVVELAELLIVVQLQVEHALVAEVRIAPTRLGVQRHQLIADGDIEDAFLGPVGPIGHAVAGQLARGLLGPRALFDPVHPQKLAGGGVQSDHVAACADRGEHDALDHQGGGFQVEFRARTKGVRLETPGHLQIVEVGGVDLIQRRIAVGGQVAGIGAPLGIGRRQGFSLGLGASERRNLGPQIGHQ